MTSISAPRDDEGILRLRLHTNATALTGGLEQLQPYPGARPAADGVRRDAPSGGRRPRQRGADRRRGERRRHDIPVLLDTRSQRERRSRLRRRADRPAQPLQPSTASRPGAPRRARLGVDCYA